MYKLTKFLASFVAIAIVFTVLSIPVSANGLNYKVTYSAEEITDLDQLAVISESFVQNYNSKEKIISTFTSQTNSPFDIEQKTVRQLLERREYNDGSNEETYVATAFPTTPVDCANEQSDIAYNARATLKVYYKYYSSDGTITGSSMIKLTKVTTTLLSKNSSDIIKIRHSYGIYNPLTNHQWGRDMTNQNAPLNVANTLVVTDYDINEDYCPVEYVNMSNYMSLVDASAAIYRNGGENPIYPLQINVRYMVP